MTEIPEHLLKRASAARVKAMDPESAARIRAEVDRQRAITFDEAAAIRRAMSYSDEDRIAELEKRVEQLERDVRTIAGGPAILPVLPPPPPRPNRLPSPPRRRGLFARLFDL